MTDIERKMLAGLKLAEKYLYKAVAEDLMNDCVMSPKIALQRITKIIDTVEKGGVFGGKRSLEQ